MSSNYLAILADIKAKLLGITDIGVVHDYYRFNTDPGKFITLFAYTPTGGSKQVRGWELTRISAPEKRKSIGLIDKIHKFRAAGYMSLKDADATDKTFQVLVDNVCETFRTAASGVSAWDYIDADNPGAPPVQANIIEVREFGGVLCHYAEIDITVIEEI